MRRTREFYKLTDIEYTLVFEDKGQGVQLYYFTCNKGRPCILMFKGKRQKPSVHCYYENDFKRAQACESLINLNLQQKEKDAQKLALKKAFKHNLKIGDVLHSSWGYEQTNNDFYQVVKLTDKTVTVQEIASSYESTGCMQGNRKPIIGKIIGEPMQRRVCETGNIRINSCQLARKCDPFKSYADSSYA